MQNLLHNIVNRLFPALIAVLLVCGLSGCIRQTSEDSEILNDAGTQEGAAIILDPDEESEGLQNN